MQELLRNLATTHNLIGDLILTKDYLYRAFKVNPDVLPVTLNLAKIALQQMDFGIYKETVDTLKEKWEDDANVMSMVSEMDKLHKELEDEAQ